MNYLLKKFGAVSKRLLTFITISALLFVSLPAFACGCGIVLVPGSISGWSYGEDSSEQSFINFEKGIEKLVIGLDIKNRDISAVLVVPVPSAPESVKADVLTEFPKLSGYDVKTKAHENLSSIRDSLLMTQIYPGVALFLKLMAEGVNQGGSVPIPGGTIGLNDFGGNNGVTVYQHLEKEGMIAEVLSASTPDSLYNYLIQKGLRVEKNSIPVFKDYINKDFSFVVSWISPNVDNSSARGLFMTFPAKKIFYPLKPGSAYAGSGMDKTVTIVGHVSPDIFSDIKATTDVKYFESYAKADNSLKDFFSSDKVFGFTKIVIKSSPDKLTQDLYISNHAPLSVLNAQLINHYTFLYGLILMILLSFVLTFSISRFILLLPLSSIQLAKLSVFSCFTIIGTIVGARILLTNKRFKFVTLFSFLFVGAVLLSCYLLSLLYI